MRIWRRNRKQENESRECWVCGAQAHLTVLRSGEPLCLGCLADGFPDDARLIARYITEFKGLRKK